MISEEDSAFTHGRIPAHKFRESMNVSLLLLRAKANLSRHRAMIFGIGFDAGVCFDTQQSALPMAARAYAQMISCHYMSYDCFSCPYKFYELPKVDSPHNQFSSTFFHLRRPVVLRRQLIELSCTHLLWPLQ
jgi:hypothetical protein